MPQMSPIKWLTLLIMFLMIFIMFNMMNFFNYNLMIPKFKNKLNIKSINWKW